MTHLSSRLIAGVLAALLLAGCAYTVEIDGVRHDVRVYPLATTATDAPDATATPAPPTPTLTPTATVEPSATPTQLPLTATPTQEVTLLPPITPRPTMKPSDLICEAGVIVNGRLNIRDRPDISGTRIGTLDHAQRVAISELLVRYPEGSPVREEWGKLRDHDGWIALWFNGTELARLDDDAPCWELPITRLSLQPLVGFKVVPGVSADTIARFADIVPETWDTVAFVVQDTGLSTALEAKGVMAVFVPWTPFPGDCPNMSMSPETSALNRIAYVERQANGASFSAIVLSNECEWPSAEYYRDWSMAAIEECNRRGWTCITTVWNTGAPELDWLDTLEDLHCYMEITGNPFGINIYPYYPTTLMNKSDQTQYTTWRFELIKESMRCDPLWFVTELAPDGGGWPPDVGDTAAFINTTRGEFDAIGVWYYGGASVLPAWPDAAWGDADMTGLAKSLK